MELKTEKDLIEYGFKRVIEELQKNRTELLNLQHDVMTLTEAIGKAKSYSQITAANTEKIKNLLEGGCHD